MRNFIRKLFNRPKVRTGINALKAITRYTTALVAFTAGALGIGILFQNPVPLLASYLPVRFSSDMFGSLLITEEYLQSIVTAFYTDPVIWGSSTTISSLLIFVALFLLVQHPKQTLKSLGRGIKASPKALLRSPITFYRKALKFRNWFLAKVDYLQGESDKWRRTFMVMKSPYSFLRMMGFSPQMAMGLLVAGGTVGGGVAVNETVFADRSFNRGDSGIYAASVVGNGANLDAPTEYIEGSNTLRIDLGTTPVREITIENVSVGTVFTGSALPSGETNVVQVSGNTISGGTNTRLEVGHFIFENSRCKKLTMTDIQAHTLIVKGNASDGQSIAPSPGTSRMRAIGGGHQQADAMITNGGTYDRIWIQAPSSGVNGKVGTLRLSNLYTKGGDCVLSKMNIGTLEILLNEIGMGDGFNTKEFTIATTVTGANITVQDNVEVTIAEPATTGH